MNDKTIAVLGSGWVGLTSAAIFANSGFRVYVVDVDKKKVDTLKQTIVPFYEKGLEELVKNGLSSGQLIPTTDYKQAVSSSSIVI